MPLPPPGEFSFLLRAWRVPVCEGRPSWGEGMCPMPGQSRCPVTLVKAISPIAKVNQWVYPIRQHKELLVSTEIIDSKYLSSLLQPLSSVVLAQEQPREVKWKLLGHIWLFATPWTVAHQAPLSMGFSRQEDWCGLPCPPPAIFPTQESNPGLPHCRQVLYPLNYSRISHR